MAKATSSLTTPAARGKFEELKAYCAQTGVKDRQLEIWPEVHDFIAGIWRDLEDDGWVPSR